MCGSTQKRLSCLRNELACIPRGDRHEPMHPGLLQRGEGVPDNRPASKSFGGRNFPYLLAPYPGSAIGHLDFSLAEFAQVKRLAGEDPSKPGSPMLARNKEHGP